MALAVAVPGPPTDLKKPLAVKMKPDTSDGFIASDCLF